MLLVFNFMPGIRSLLPEGTYMAAKNLAVSSITSFGEKLSSPVKTLKEDYPMLYKAHYAVENEVNDMYEFDEIGRLGWRDALIREVFNSREVNRFGMLGFKEAYLSRLKMDANRLLQPSDPTASHGLGNIKAYRITQDVYQKLPVDVQNAIPFRANGGYIDPTAMSRYLSPPSLAEAYRRTGIFYGAVYGAYRDQIDSVSEANGFSPELKRYVASVVVCCSDPVDYDVAQPGQPAYDNGFMLLKYPDYTARHFDESKDVILARQELSDRFFNE